jgi:hypothetical protein
MRKLELNKETLRDLSEEDLRQVSGGNKITEYLTQSPVCPSGATWFQECNTTNCS